MQRIIPLLLDAQHEHGYLSVETLNNLSRQHTIPLHRLQQIISFYPHFRTTPPPKVELTVCRDMSCYLYGGEQHIQALKQLASADIEVHEVSCPGRCDRAPIAAINGIPIEANELDRVRHCLNHPEDLPPIRRAETRAWECDPYASAQEHFATIQRVRQSRVPGQSIIDTLKQSGLRGMGGAGFPTGTKWELVAKQPNDPKYVVCNADESEPGTFKDREILADLPHLVIEGMMLAGYTIGAKRGILYIRHEYPAEQARFEAALQRAYALGVLGQPDAHGWQFDLEVFVSPGGYILGEETALLEALEDKRGEPRNKPPFPGVSGLDGQPTLINNVETLAMTTVIVNRGADWWKAQGRPGYAGFKFISVSGHVAKPDVYLIRTGTTVRELIEMAGGMVDGKQLLAFAPGGASSNFLPANQVDVALDFNALQKAGSMLGSGAMVVVAAGTDLLALATNVVKFFRNESCGKCVPCRVGSQKAVEILEGYQAGQLPRTSLAVLPDLGETMLQTSICGLGQIAIAPALSMMKMFELPK